MKSIRLLGLLSLMSLPFSLLAAPLPNIVIIFTDDQGYADVGVFGAKGFTTPNLDRMAHEGRRFTDWHAAQPVCSASRTALLTGCYSNRLGIHGALGPGSKVGISDGEILGPLKQNGVDENTLVIFTSDNGPWLSYGNHAGSAGPLREGKGTTFDGGHREPFIARWPGHIPADTVCPEPAMNIDLFPT